MLLLLLLYSIDCVIALKKVISPELNLAHLVTLTVLACSAETVLAPG